LLAESARLHFMSESANETTVASSARIARRQATAHRIAVCAQQLAAERGLDGFTMEDLATRAEVSRRTLFNYFPSKDDAVLGGIPEPDPGLVATFRAGGPTGDLIEDVAVIVRAVFETKDYTREEVALSRRVMLDNPRLIALSQRRIEEVIEGFMEHVRARDGADFDRYRAQVAFAVIVAISDLALNRFLSDARRRDLSPVFTEALQITRELFS
jgi:AcrR family transcriptional regulator